MPEPTRHPSAEPRTRLPKSSFASSGLRPKLLLPGEYAFTVKRVRGVLTHIGRGEAELPKAGTVRVARARDSLRAPPPARPCDRSSAYGLGLPFASLRRIA